MLSYQIPSHQHSCETEVKRSRFIAYAQHCQGSAGAKSFIQAIKNKYPDARHHCHAFIAGAPDNSNLYGFSDDGEPSGTAGMPIFTHLKHSELGETVLVVVRYFGGTKLGTGGLARAYGNAAKSVLTDLKTQEFIKMQTLNLKVPFALEDQVRKRILSVGGKVNKADYGSCVTMEVETPKRDTLNLPYSVETIPESTI